MPATCTLKLTIFDDDRTTELWLVSTDPDELNPFLKEPDALAEQELEAAECRASIGSVTVVLVDWSQIVEDQTAGWITDKLAAYGIANLAGRRARLERYISAEIGWQVVLDGVAGTPELESSYAAYRLEIKDTRESERKLTAFTTAGGNNTILPEGTLLGYGFNEQDSSLLLDRTIQTPLLGKTVRPPSEGSGADNYTTPTTAYVDLTVDPGNDATLRDIRDSTYDRATSQSREAVTGRNLAFPIQFFDWVRYRFPQLELWWRAQGSSDPWSVIPGSQFVIDNHTALRPNRAYTGSTTIKPVVVGAGAADGFKRVTRIFFGDARSGDYIGGESPEDPPLLYIGPDPPPAMPSDGDDIELLLVIGGTLSRDNPLHLEGMSAGTFLRNLYRGDYSPREADGSAVPTGIRYDEDALADLEEPVRLRLMEPIDDARTWAEEHIYSPLGWLPAIDSDGRISPMTTAAPVNADDLPIIEDAITEPSPTWSAGDRIINVVRFTGARDYKPDPDTDTDGDGLTSVPLIVEYRDPVSISRFGEQVLEIDASAFRGIGQEGSGDPVDTGDEEAITRLARERAAQILPRYALGAPVITVNILRTAYPLLRAGDWVILNLSWFPDYVTQKRGLVALAQVVGLQDLDCAWRRITCEVVPFGTPAS